MTDAADALAAVWNSERRRIVTSVARRLGDLDAAEDAVQDAVRIALDRWERDGVPANPGAWLTTAAWHRALDVIRADRRIDAYAVIDGVDSAPATSAHRTDATRDPDEVAHEDDTVVMLVACTHPSLASPDAVALALRHVSGFPVEQIASVFLVDPAAMQKRLVRIRRRIKDTGIALERPTTAELPHRLPAARAAVLLAFTLGHTPPSGDRPVLVDVCDEAVWLARQLRTLAPTDQESTGLLALLLLLRARLDARTAPGDLDGVELEDVILAGAQDPDRWDAALIAEAKALLATTGTLPPGPYSLQAAIALAHTTPGQPDWALIAALHGALARAGASSMALVNRAYAIGQADGPEAGLRVLAEARADRVRDSAAYHAVEASLLDAAGRHSDAQASWNRAHDRTRNHAHRRRIAERLDGDARSPS